MAISRAQLAKELEPGLNALFGMEYARYDDEHAEIYETESSDRAFEEEVMLTGFGSSCQPMHKRLSQHDIHMRLFLLLSQLLKKRLKIIFMIVLQAAIPKR